MTEDFVSTAIKRYSRQVPEAKFLVLDWGIYVVDSGIAGGHKEMPSILADQ
jgi:hypothetical protein